MEYEDLCVHESRMVDSFDILVVRLHPHFQCGQNPMNL